MSFCRLRGLTFYVRRQAAAFTQPSRLVILSSEPGQCHIRSKHTSLYQMVKKRTLDARTKLQPSNLPPTGENVCLQNSTQNQNVADRRQKAFIPSSSASPTPPLPPPPPPPQPNPNSFRANQSTTSAADCFPKGEKTQPKQPQPNVNTKVLNTGDCDNKKKCHDKHPPVCPPPPSSGKRIGGIWWVVGAGALAALTGGLLYLLFSKKKKDKPMKGILCVPESSAELPKHVPYLLIGGGAASFSAFRAIKSNDAKAKILMVTNECSKPYMRPPLSKELWYSAKQVDMTKDYRFKQWTGAERSLFFEPEEFFVHPAKLMSTANGGVSVAQGYTVKKIDPIKQVAILSDGYEIGYDECLIATGCTPKNLHVFDDAPLSVREKVMLYRTPADFERLKRYADEKQSITIVGNGFTGSELACSLANYTKEKAVKIYQVFPESGIMSKILPDYLSTWTMRRVEETGVCVLPNVSVSAAQRDNSSLKVTLSNGNTIVTDVVVVCVGCEANTDIALLSGLEVDRKYGGFVVNAELEARSNLYVAGDAACFYDPKLGRRRVEHHDHSVVSGRLAGENMVGKRKPYEHQSMFWSDLGPEIGYEGIGLVDSSLQTVAVFALPTKSDRKTDNLSVERPPPKDAPKGGTTEPKYPLSDDKENFGRGVIFYLKNDKIVGILLWNIFNRIGLARTVLNQDKKFNDLNEVAKLFEIHT